MKIKVSNVNTPNWKEVTVKSRIPEELEKLSEIARNIWWAWNFEATELFRDLDPELWKECGQNPVLLLERMSYEKLEALAKDKVILRRMNEVYTKFRDYMDVKPDEQRPSIAYFSMEYGLSSVLKIYSGGLGVLAGDYLKEASDSNVDLCAVGFLYRYGRTVEEQTTPVTIRKGKLEVALFNTIPLPIENWPRAEGKPDICRASVKRLAAAIRKYKASHPSARIVAVLHWGTEFQPISDMQQRYDAHLLVQAGADAIIGHHPHVVQPLEYIDSRPVFYSLGNFVFDQSHPDCRKASMALLCFKASEVQARAIPVEIRQCRPQISRKQHENR